MLKAGHSDNVGSELQAHCQFPGKQTLLWGEISVMDGRLLRKFISFISFLIWRQKAQPGASDKLQVTLGLENMHLEGAWLAQSLQH